MKKQQFLNEISRLLTSLRIEDVDEIVLEYEQHIDCKLMDGYSEEEICAKLGSPVEIVEQYKDLGKKINAKLSKKILIHSGLSLVDMLAASFLIVFAAWIVALASAAIACLAITAVLLTGVDSSGIIPQMPYHCAFLFGITFATFSVFFTCSTLFAAFFLKQLFRSYMRWHYNILAACKSKPKLPPFPIYPQLNTAYKRKIKNTFLISAMAFMVLTVLSYFFSAIAAGSMEFWHIWKWFT